MSVGGGSFPPGAASLLHSGNVLTSIRVTSHDTFYDGLYRVVSDDPDMYQTQFDMLIGSYCNALTLVKFLETGLSVACMCVKYPELDYTNKGAIQFKVILPSMAKSNLEAAEKPTYLFITKNLERSNLRSCFTISNEACALLLGERDDGTRLSEYHKQLAIGQLVQNVQAVLDAFERGTVNQVLEVLLLKAPPTPILKVLNTYINQNTPLDKVGKANLVSLIKRHIMTDMFFMNKHKSEQLISRIAEMIGATRPSISMPQITHVAPGGTPVDGVIVTTEHIRDQLLTMRSHLVATEAIVPTTYANMIVDGNNVVTAISMGKAVNTFEQLAKNILEFKGEQLSINKEIVADSLQQQGMITIPANLMSFSNKLVFLEALESVYRSVSNKAYPLITNVDLSFLMPIGISKPAIDRYAGKGMPAITDASNPRLFPPTCIYFYNKDQTLVRLSFEDALGTLCHPLTLNMSSFTDDITSADLITTVHPYGSTVAHTNAAWFLNRTIAAFLDHIVEHPDDFALDSHVINRLSSDQFLRADNLYLTLERSPYYDFYTVYSSIRPITQFITPVAHRHVGVSLRAINGNLPLPLCSTDYRNNRGLALAAGNHAMSQETIRAIQATFDDVNYPPVFYMIEAAIHGNERHFATALRLVTQCITSYWNNSRCVAFINSYPMVAFILTYLGNGEVPMECISVYRDLMAHISALRHLISEYTLPGERLHQHSQEALNNLLTDPAFLPPVIYNADSFLTPEFAAIRDDRNFEYRIHNDNVIISHEGVDVTNAQWDDITGRIYHPGTDNATAISDNEWQINNKIFYYIIVPAFARGKCCTMGVHFRTLYDHLARVIIDTDKDKTSKQVTHPKRLTKSSLNTLFHNYNLSDVDSQALTSIGNLANNIAVHSHIVLYSYRCDPGTRTNYNRYMTTYDAALYNGILIMQYPKRDRLIMFNDLFYAVPVNGFYADRDAVTLSHNKNLVGLDPTLPVVPTVCSCDRLRAIRYPMVQYAASSKAPVNQLTHGLLGCFFKMSPVGFISQLRNGFHPGFALTVVRQDRFAAEQILYAEKGSEGIFFGNTDMTKVDDVDGLSMDLNQSRAHIDLGLGFTATSASAYLQTPITDMGNMPQNLFNTKALGDFYNQDVQDFVRRYTCDRNKACFPDLPPTSVFSHISLAETPAMERGQPSINEFVVTPVSADLKYFYESSNPRGRSGCVITCADYSDAMAEKLLFDHSFPDPAFPFRATNNPWASQKFSLGDVVYNTGYNQSVTHNTFISPCAKFFTAQEIVSKNKSFLKMLSDFDKTMSTSSSKTDYQFKSPVSSRELVRDPCAFFQEAYPPLCSTDASLFRKYHTNAAYVNAHEENYFSQYLIEDASPLQGILSFIR
ncbi:major capsid protein [Testudinid alphaherpesvirus 3]|uniref:Major capsid protein n=1 Tax=Testudinid alphaherpesvirus 3 TaxID=2560801 RepID=A0A0K1R1W8_9ALPH|nr:major capsid protein [Testudinid alphaherpesvirus 3]AIU39276.1 major capsid protein [Testudinid alphaherpesvirus 3]AIU39386.1 major capsid protein [Testudinid alphaherpesvirus 3]AKI81662.1 major capsid protein [Testudinid alphaherpesvirus 3]AKI81765.1 major capsid protein [Testudinid alphaherpesvirus 3]AKV40691.1 UL19 major capsid protein [Testudinid alphaherpesvirus 3]